MDHLPCQRAIAVTCDSPRQPAYKFPHYTALAKWEARAAWLRQHIWVMLGLWPQPERSALHARVTARLDEDDYCVENVCFESWPGFLVHRQPLPSAWPAGTTPRHPEPPRPLGAWTDGP